MQLYDMRQTIGDEGIISQFLTNWMQYQSEGDTIETGLIDGWIPAYVMRGEIFQRLTAIPDACSRPFCRVITELMGTIGASKYPK
jgi:hypothetical protein